MKIPFSLDVVVPRIIELGMKKAPNEACGLVVPDLDLPCDEWVHELTNRSPDPTNSYTFDTSVVKELLTNPEVWEDILVWHTHPGGRVGPSPGDMEARHPKLKYLVVALPRGEAVIF